MNFTPKPKLRESVCQQADYAGLPMAGCFKPIDRSTAIVP